MGLALYASLIEEPIARERNLLPPAGRNPGVPQPTGCIGESGSRGEPDGRRAPPACSWRCAGSEGQLELDTLVVDLDHPAGAVLEAGASTGAGCRRPPRTGSSRRRCVGKARGGARRPGRLPPRLLGASRSPRPWLPRRARRFRAARGAPARLVRRRRPASRSRRAPRSAPDRACPSLPRRSRSRTRCGTESAVARSRCCGCLRRRRSHGAGNEGAEDVLRCRLPDRPGDRDDLCPAQVAHRPAERGERRERSSGDELPRRRGREPPRHIRCRGRSPQRGRPPRPSASRSGRRRPPALPVATQCRMPGPRLAPGRAGSCRHPLRQLGEARRARPLDRRTGWCGRRSPGSCPFPATTTTSPSPTPQKSSLDRRGAVGLDRGARPGAADDLVDDRKRILAARVVRRDDVRIGQARGDFARPDASPDLDRRRSRKTQMTWREASARASTRTFSSASRRMRIVDQDGEGLPLVHRFEATGDSLNVLDPATDRAVVDTEDTRRGGAPRMFDVEAPPKPCADPKSRRDLELRARSTVHVAGADVGVRGQARRSRRYRRRPKLLGESPPVSVGGGVGDGGRSATFQAGLDEELALRLEVLVHRPVKVEVILGQVP